MTNLTTMPENHEDIYSAIAELLEGHRQNVIPTESQ
jgi:hypothetical protein